VTLGALVLGVLGAASDGLAQQRRTTAPAATRPARRRGPRCPDGTVHVPEARVCIDRYEASLVEVVGRGQQRPHSPHEPPAQGVTYRAVSRPNVLPQGYISQVQAAAACEHANRRLCTEQEWEAACRGPQPTTWPYGDTQQPGRCNDDGVNPVPRLYGRGDVFHDAQMNDPRLNTLPRTTVRTGSRRRCGNRYGVRDMVGNLHEWVSNRTRSGHGVFRGGYFSDVRINGEGCGYATRAHNPTYRDYSIGFRCCATPR
jgi:sulfatase modifying factor 1